MYVVEFIGVICGVILMINFIFIIIFKVMIVIKIGNLIIFVFYLSV